MSQKAVAAAVGGKQLLPDEHEVKPELLNQATLLKNFVLGGVVEHHWLQ